MSSSTSFFLDRPLAILSPDEKKRRLFASFGLTSSMIAAALATGLAFGVGDPSAGRLFLFGLLLSAAALLVWTYSARPWVWMRVYMACLLALGFQEIAGGISSYTFLWLYLLPPVVFFLFGRREGTAWTLATWLATSYLLLIEPQGGNIFPVSVRFFFSFGILILLTFESERAARFYSDRLRTEKRALVNALQDIRVLQGFLPICAGCKSIRDDRGFWSSVELYLGRHSLARITEAMCPECRAEQGEPDLDPTERPRTERRPARRSTVRADRRRGLKYLRICLGFVASMGVAFGSADWMRNHHLEALVELGTAGLSLALAIGAGRWIPLRAAGHGFAGMIVVFIVFELYVGGSGGHAFLWSLVLPPIFMAILGRQSGTGWSMALFLAMAVVFNLPRAHQYPVAPIVQFGLVYLFLSVLCIHLEQVRDQLKDRWLHENAELSAALDHARTLRGILPLCPSCKSVRDDDGFWRQVEDYLTSHTGASTSHGLCPECSAKEMQRIATYDA